MTKKEYIRELRKRLQSLPNEEIEDAIHYVEEYFDEAGEGNEEQVIADLGSPAKFANQIKADVQIKQAELMRYKSSGKHSEKQQSSLKSILLIALGILSLPVSFPLVLVILALIFVLFVLLAIPMIVLIGFVLAFFGISIFMIKLLVTGAIKTLADSLLLISGLMIATAVLCLVIAGFIALATKFFPWLSIKLGQWYHHLKGEDHHE